MPFSKYTDSILSALTFNPKQQDVIARKQEILDGVYRVENLEPTSVLFFGFNPAILSCKAGIIGVTEISIEAQEFLKSNGVKFTFIPQDQLVQFKKKFQVVVAMDEYLTFATSDQDQQNKITLVCGLATSFVVSTVRDYKNQDFKDRDFSSPIMVRNGSEQKVFLEAHDWDLKDRTHWTTKVFEIDSNNQLNTYGAFERRTMFFKQLAKFSHDAGAVNFLVHKNLMYKSLIKKNYEHVVSIQFD
jgi:hypothetical protein